MAGLSKETCLCISRIKSSFKDSIGNAPTGYGTGFWCLTEKQNKIYVTNKHNVDCNVKFKSKEIFDLTDIQIELRKKEGNRFFSETEFFSVNLQETSLITEENIDLAVFVNPIFKEHKSNYEYKLLGISEWSANHDFFANRSRIASDVSFVGYPTNFYDSTWKLPIARHAIIASVAEIGFSHNEINLNDIVLVSGLSFGGGSGSPVFSSQRGLKINLDRGFAESDDYCPQKLLGVMTGHLQFPKETEKFMTKKEEEFTRHSGLSYFTKFTALDNIIRKNNL